MYHTIFAPLTRRQQRQITRLLALALLPLLLVTSTGYAAERLPVPVAVATSVRRIRRRCCRRPPVAPPLRGSGALLQRTLPPVLGQTSLLLLLLVGGRAPTALLLLASLPLLRWLLTLSALVWPAWAQRPSCRWLRQVGADLHLALLLALGGHLLGQILGLTGGALLGAAATPTRSPKPTASGRILEDGTYEVFLGDQFVIRHQPVDEFDRRMFLLSLRNIHLVDHPSKRPFVCQVWLAQWFGTLQELISRWEDYREAGDWTRLMSRHHGPLLPRDQQQAIIQHWARHLWWSVAEVQAAAAAEGVTLSQDAITQIGQDSGLLAARRVLRERFQLSATTLRPKDDWLVSQLFAQLDQLQAHLEAGTRPMLEQQGDLRELLALRKELGLGSGRELERPLPWAYHLQQVLCGDWQTADDEPIRCPHCGGSQVRRKSRTPRQKRFYDAEGQLQTVDVFRYYCQNPACPQQTFTNLPPDLLPYSPWRAEVQLAALGAYELGRGSYRRVASGLGVSTATAARWVSQFGGQLLPVAALFGVVQSSGVVGVDEKWVRVHVPGKRGSRWMYVSVAVDCSSYDLLHIAIAPTVGTASAQAFLLALKAKGYRPQVIVTDLNQEYGAAIAAVFPQAEHHECVFHALQNWQAQVRKAYGKDYREQHPEAVALLRQLKRIFWATTKRTAERRYARVLALREAYVAAQPEVATVFTSLEHHWPKLVNAIESERIPLTNNTTELVIRRFAQHYQNFCGFHSIETAERYLVVFEWCYRLTPFTQDAQQRIRGKCPLELAGYDVSKLPMAQLCRGQLLGWPPESLAEVVPKP
ncbi:transposase [Candidatus Chloroploca sp. Khr17]|uniref:IS66 family transposase n=1 Tax=Candidatus Chloroploca sp. Khr17 TaxID=2496869 RepID=UPI00101CFDE1|nr:transposase [Candidatus Chloroploca sp. Khr17]